MPVHNGHLLTLFIDSIINNMKIQRFNIVIAEANIFTRASDKYVPYIHMYVGISMYNIKLFQRLELCYKNKP